MSNYRRALFTLFALDDDEILDVASLLRGQVKIASETKLFAYSPISSSRCSITLEELEFLQRVPADRWVSESELSEFGMPGGEQCIESFVRHGILLADGDDPEHHELNRRDDALSRCQWHPYAAFYHFMTRASERLDLVENESYVSKEMQAAERASQFVEEHGPPPAPFNSISGAPRHELPRVEKQGELYNLLERRTTTRGFDSDGAISLEDFSILLFHTFGFHGVTQLSPEVSLFHRTSPSGGARHPVEVYPLVLQVEGLAVGIYHYDPKDHALELIKEYDLEIAKALAVEMTAGQDYAGSAHVLFVMTARFFRNFWKYRQRSRAYGVILMDSAHLSQTLYLIAADLGLGAFFTAAINGPKTEEILGIDGYEEGAIAVCGCGVKAREEESRLQLNFRPLTPGKTDS